MRREFLRALKTLIDAETPLTARQLAYKARITRDCAYRYIRILDKHGFADVDLKNGNDSRGNKKKLKTIKWKK